MTRFAMLNNVAHKDLRVITRHGAEFGENVGMVVTMPTEFADVQKEYPIVFRKDRESGEFQTYALLGFDKTENLFLEGDKWNASYVPGMIARGPFLIGIQEQQAGGQTRKEPVIHIDLEDKRVSSTEGQPVFMPQGGNSPYLDQIALILRGIRDGFDIGKTMFKAFADLDLIQPMNVQVQLNAEEAVNLSGLYGLSEQKLSALESDSVWKLHRSGFLQGAYLILASMSNVPKLIAMRQRRRASKG